MARQGEVISTPLYRFEAKPEIPNQPESLPSAATLKTVTAIDAAIGIVDLLAQRTSLFQCHARWLRRIRRCHVLRSTALINMPAGRHDKTPLAFTCGGCCTTTVPARTSTGLLHFHTFTINASGIGARSPARSEASKNATRNCQCFISSS